MADRTNEREVARSVFARSVEIDVRGHDAYCRQARKCENYYLGGGLQWDPEVRAEIEASGRPVHEINDIMPAVNSAGGYQIANRMDIAYLPRGRGTDEQLAKAFSKYAKHCLDNTNYRDHETTLYLDGLIQQRGFFDIRMDYQTNTRGEVAIDAMDPMDVKIDPDARDYDPDTWSDVLISRWLTLRQIENLYGKNAADYAKEHSTSYGCSLDGTQNGSPVDRAQFGDRIGQYTDTSMYGNGLSYRVTGGLVRYLVVERQSFELQNTLVAEYKTGDLRILDGVEPSVIAGAIAQGAYVAKRRIQRVRWETVLPDAVIFNGIVPYEHFTPVPFFPYFRRGRTRGMVDNAISPQDMTNKFVSQFAATVNSTANSGYDVEEDQLISHSVRQLEEQGSQTGIVIVRKKGSPPINKIKPNDVPTGLDKMIQYGADGIRRATGINESLTGAGGADMSGVAIQSRQFAAQQQLAIPLWRLSQTRRMVGARLQWMIQRFMIDERTVRITESDEYGIERHNMMSVNQVQPDGSILNDLTAGEYDMAITEQPMQVTFDNSQFEQIKSMRKDMAVSIPDSVVLRYSTLPDKEEIAAAIKEQAQQNVDPVAQAQAKLLEANALKSGADAERSKAEAVTKTAEALFSAGRVAQMVAADPSIAELADMIYKSAGGIDHDAAPVIGTPAPGVHSAPPPNSTHPLTPDNPDTDGDLGADVGLGTIAPPTSTPPPME